MMGHKMLTMTVLATLLIVVFSGCVPDQTDSLVANKYSVQEIAQALSDWQQVNASGFGDPKELEISALEAFNGYLYAGTYNIVEPAVLFDGARIFRSPDGVTWTPVTQPGFQNPHDSAPPAILDFVVFGNRLYASTGRGGNPAQIWRSSNGVSWAPMVTAGFGDPDIHDIDALAVYNNIIYAGASSQVSGARIYRSTTGDSNTWNSISPASPTMGGAGVTGFAVFNGALYATVESEAPVQIWRSTNGSTWTSVINNGFGDSNTVDTGGIAVFGGYLYIGAGNAVNGAQLWRSNNGTSWSPAITPAFGDPNNQKIETVLVFQNELYVSVKNTVTGMEIWRTTDGVLWEQTNLDGFGDINNTGTNRSNATADFMSQFYVGTSNIVDGGELWRKLQQLPATSTATSTNTSTFTPTNTATSTPTHTATYTSTSTATSTLTYTLTVSSTPTHTATNTFTYTPTGTATITQTNTPTSTPVNTPSYTPSFTPTNTPTPTPYPNIPGKVTGGGNIEASVKKVTFGFEVRYDDGDENPTGNLIFKDHSIKLDLKASFFTVLYIEDKHAMVSGYATVDGIPNLSFTLEIFLQDEPDKGDIIMIEIPHMNDYSFIGSLSGGSVKIEPAR